MGKPTSGKKGKGGKGEKKKVRGSAMNHRDPSYLVNRRDPLGVDGAAERRLTEGDLDATAMAIQAIMGGASTVPKPEDVGGQDPLARLARDMAAARLKGTPGGTVSEQRTEACETRETWRRNHPKAHMFGTVPMLMYGVREDQDQTPPLYALEFAPVRMELAPDQSAAVVNENGEERSQAEIDAAREKMKQDIEAANDRARRLRFVYLSPSNPPIRIQPLPINKSLIDAFFDAPCKYLDRDVTRRYKYDAMITEKPILNIPVYTSTLQLMTYDGGARPYVCTSRESMMIALCTRDVIIAAIQSKKPNSKGEATLLEAMRKECSFIVEETFTRTVNYQNQILDRILKHAEEKTLTMDVLLRELADLTITLINAYEISILRLLRMPYNEETVLDTGNLLTPYAMPDIMQLHDELPDFLASLQRNSQDMARARYETGQAILLASYRYKYKNRALPEDPVVTKEEMEAYDAKTEAFIAEARARHQIGDSEDAARLEMAIAEIQEKRAHGMEEIKSQKAMMRDLTASVEELKKEPLALGNFPWVKREDFNQWMDEWTVKLKTAWDERRASLVGITDPTKVPPVAENLKEAMRHPVMSWLSYEAVAFMASTFETRSMPTMLDRCVPLSVKPAEAAGTASAAAAASAAVVPTESAAAAAAEPTEPAPVL